jgi:hypothetical protein
MAVLLDKPSTVLRVLMNRNTPVLKFVYDLDRHAILEITEVYNAKAAPLYITRQSELSGLFAIGSVALHNWWRTRALPLSRENIRRLLRIAGIEDIYSLVDINFGLSLSDQYWVNSDDRNQEWERINFFENDFDTRTGMMLAGVAGVIGDSSLPSPDITTGGQLRKWWEIDNEGKRNLLKEGRYPLSQEPYNEAIATELYARLLDASDYVPYSLVEHKERPYSKCANMLTSNEELVPYSHILNHTATTRTYEGCVEAYRSLGLGRKVAAEALSKMLVCDYILANHDRHLGNFGVIRNVETLDVERPAPIFDTGNSLWCDVPPTSRVPNPLAVHGALIYEARPFYKDPLEQMKLSQELSWYDPSLLDGFDDVLVRVLSENGNMEDMRIDEIVKRVNRNIFNVTDHAMQIDRQMRHRVFVPESGALNPSLPQPSLDDEAKDAKAAVQRESRSSLRENPVR